MLRMGAARAPRTNAANAEVHAVLQADVDPGGFQVAVLVPVSYTHLDYVLANRPVSSMSIRKPRSTRAGRVTMQEVADRAGVSAITVSRALRTPDKVAEAVRQRIAEVCRELGYVPKMCIRDRCRPGA